MAQTAQQLEQDNQLLRTRLDRALDSIDSLRLEKMKILQHNHELQRTIKELKAQTPIGFSLS